MKALLLALALGGLNAHGQISPVNVAEPEAAPVVKPRAPGAILLIGDSHAAGRFGDGLDKLLRGLAGWEVHTFAVSGSSAWFWAGDGDGVKTPRPHAWLHRDPAHPKEPPTRGPEGESTPGPWRLRRIAPEGLRAVVVALGTNHHFMPAKAAAAKTAPLMREIAEAGAACIWIGPPPLRPAGSRYHIKEGWVDEFYGHLSKLAAENSCGVVDSRKILGAYPEKGGDEIHYDGFPEKIGEWSQGAFERIQAALP